MSGFYWLASYPKSGNTWMRALLQACYEEPEHVLDLNHLGGGGLVRARGAFDGWCGAPSADMTVDEIACLLPAFIGHLAGGVGRYPFVKTHGACLLNRDGEWVHDPLHTAGAILVVRHPGDVAVSLMHHLALDLDGVLEMMGTHDTWFGGQRHRLGSILPEVIGSWSQHCASWLDGPHRKMCIRYEDLLEDTVREMNRVLAFMGVARDSQHIGHAVETSRFERLQQQETDQGFVERPAHALRFFRQGTAGGWRETFSAAQRARLRRDHEPVMRRLGYAP